MLPHGEVAATITKVRSSWAWPGTKAAVDFLALTACRSGEARLAERRKVDRASGVWIIPAAFPGHGANARHRWLRERPSCWTRCDDARTVGG